jgi:hypothetical protein
MSGAEVEAFDSDRQLIEHLRRVGRLSVAVRTTTELFRERTESGADGRNLAKIMKSLNRGPLGAAIDLPGHERKGRGYVVRIQGCPDGYP